MKRDVMKLPPPTAWELVDDVPPLRMLTSDDLVRLQGFQSPVNIITESCPCAPFAKREKRRIA